MAQANLPVLPQISAALAAPPAKTRAPTDAPNDEAAFSKELDKHLRPAEPPKPEAAAAKSAENPAEPPPQTAAGLRNAASRGRSGIDPPPAKTAIATTAESEAAALAAATEAAAAALAELAAVADHAVAADPLAPADPLARTDPEDAADAAAATADPLLASLAGLPAALAALLAGAGAAANGSGAAAEGAGAAAPGAATPPPSAALDTGAEALAATLARMLADTSAARTQAASAAVPEGVPNPTLTADTALLPDGTTPPLTERPGAFAAALDEATGRSDKPAVLPATETTTGPASRASETAQLAANPTAGDAARVEPNPAAAMAWAAAPGRAHAEDGGPRLVVAQPPEHPAWAESVGSKVTWLVGQGESSAELVLTPPHLGRVEVTLSVTGDQTTAQFVAATPAAREVLEQALPRLREVLAEAGIQLAQSEVSTSGRQDGSGEGNQHGTRRHEGKGTPGSELENTARPWLRRGEGLVDTFA